MKYDNLVSICIALVLVTAVAILVPCLWYFNDQNGINLQKDWIKIKSDVDSKSCKDLKQLFLETAQQPYIDLSNDKFYDEKYRYIQAKIISGDCEN